MDSNSNKRGSRKLIIFLSALVVMFAVTSVLAFMEVFNVETFRNKEETAIKEDEKTETKTTDVETNENKVTFINNEDNIGKYESKELGTLDFQGKKYTVKVEYKSDNESQFYESYLYLNDKKIDLNSGYLWYVAAMDDNYIIIKVHQNQTSNAILVYDKNLNEVQDETITSITDKFVVYDELDNNDKEVTSGTKKIKDYIDNNHIIVSYCDIETGKTNKYYQDFVEVLLTFKDGKITKEEISRTESVFCNQQR